jgi:hypothetical protein
MRILNKNTFETWILLHLTVGSSRFDHTVTIIEINQTVIILLQKSGGNAVLHCILSHSQPLSYKNQRKYKSLNSFYN